MSNKISTIKTINSQFLSQTKSAILVLYIYFSWNRLTMPDKVREVTLCRCFAQNNLILFVFLLKSEKIGKIPDCIEFFDKRD